MRTFTTATKTAADNGQRLPPVDFVLDDVKMTCRGAKNAQVAYLVAAASSTRSEQDQVAAVLDFFEQTLDPASLTVFRRRLLNTDDTFDFDDAMAIFEHVCEQWSGRPTGSGGD
jgi:hypothetical protein